MCKSGDSQVRPILPASPAGFLFGNTVGNGAIGFGLAEQGGNRLRNFNRRGDSDVHWSCGSGNARLYRGCCFGCRRRRISKVLRPTDDPAKIETARQSKRDLSDRHRIRTEKVIGLRSDRKAVCATRFLCFLPADWQSTLELSL
jgi:hypothetical protein